MQCKILSFWGLLMVRNTKCCFQLVTMQVALAMEALVGNKGQLSWHQVNKALSDTQFLI